MKKFIKMSLVLGALTLSVNSCSTRQKVDLVVYNACIYTVDTSFSIHEAFAVDKGVFLAVGSTQEIRDCYKGRKELNLQGQPFTLLLTMPTAILQCLLMD